MVTKRVIVPPRATGGPADGSTPTSADAPAAASLGASIDPGPPTMPLDPQMPLPAAPLEDSTDAAVPRPRRMPREDDLDGLEHGEAGAPVALSSFWPLLLLASSWLVWMGYHTWQLERDRQSLASLRTQLEQPFARSGQLRQALDTLAADTKRLADAGNPGARLVIEELKRRGVTIDPSAGGASAPK